MTNGTRYTWILAALLVAAGASELAARGVAPHAEAMLGSDPGRAALRAGTIVARNLSELAADQARRAAGAVVLGAVRSTTRLQQLALGVLETAGRGSYQAIRPSVTSGVLANPVGCDDGARQCGVVVAIGDPDVVVSRSRVVDAEARVVVAKTRAVRAIRTHSAHRAAVAAERCAAGKSAGISCPACPACPGKAAGRGRAVTRPAERARARATVI